MIMFLLALSGFFYSYTHSMNSDYSLSDGSYTVTITPMVDERPMTLKVHCWEVPESYLYAHVALSLGSSNEEGGNRFETIGTVLVPLRSGLDPIISRSQDAILPQSVSSQRILMGLAKHITQQPLVQTLSVSK